MKKIYWKRIVLLLAAFIPALLAHTQLTDSSLQQMIADENEKGGVGLKFTSSVTEFYTLSDHQPVWMIPGNNNNRLVLLSELSHAYNRGLEEKDYQYEEIRNLQQRNFILAGLQDSLRAELILTDAAIHYFNDIAYGNTKPYFGYNGLNYSPSCYSIPVLLKEYMMSKTLQALAEKLEAPLPEIAALEKLIIHLHRVMNDSNYREEKISSAAVTFANKPLVNRLIQLGVLKEQPDKLTDTLLKLKLKDAQQLLNVLADGVLRNTTMHELNVPLASRYKAMKLSLNYYRWLYCLAQTKSVIVVNIPATVLKVYRGRNTVLQMKVIVGKKSTPTPTLSSTVTEVILYPYWHVPFSIATKELLPAIKKNPGYIDAGNYQVLNGAGKIMDPYSINWQAFSTSYFPYTIRQSTGCDNALGLLKLNFYNPFGVYLHDTPKKSLFMTNERFYSHGCMRMEKPMDLGHLVLKNNAVAIDTLEQKGCLHNQSPIFVKADERMPVVVWYNPAGVDNTGKVVLFRDVYGKFE